MVLDKDGGASEGTAACASGTGPIIGLDPGAQGAIAILDTNSWRIVILDTPNRIVKVSQKDRVEVDVIMLSRILRANRPRLLVSEKVHAMPGQGTVSMFSFGRCFGQVEMGAAMLSVPHLTPTPQDWKGRMMVPADKDLCRQRASALIPSAAHKFARKKDADRAEAALLALFGCFWLGIVPGEITIGDAV